ncbi:Protein of unknown function [Pyronema omphalodes CBS 100304]|uniref:Uncharacterized protein n=1 Tax=Pyronema omphalodes (strain CBS 100304) TaxID=1076935 RepID=U4LI76_PYROM|nr:Protein of unknown function [Pyronema omphalodes CBS 100304]
MDSAEMIDPPLTKQPISRLLQLTMCPTVHDVTFPSNPSRSSSIQIPNTPRRKFSHIPMFHRGSRRSLKNLISRSGS